MFHKFRLNTCSSPSSSSSPSPATTPVDCSQIIRQMYLFIHVCLKLLHTLSHSLMCSPFQPLPSGVSSCQINLFLHPHFHQHFRSSALHYLCQVEATFLFGLYLLEDLHHKMLLMKKNKKTKPPVAVLAVARQPRESQLISGIFTQVRVSVVFGLVLNCFAVD